MVRKRIKKLLVVRDKFEKIESENSLKMYEY